MPSLLEERMARISAINDPMLLEDEDVEAWMRLKGRTIGGSSVGAILGINQYRTAEEVWDGFMNRAASREERSAMDRGHAMEPIIADIYARETQRTLTGDGATKVYHPRYWWMHGQSDRDIVSGHEYDSNGILEIKCHNERMFNEAKRNGVDPSYYAQIQHYMDVKQVGWGAFALFWPDGWELFHFDLLINPAFVAEKNARLEEFWRVNILGRRRPGAPQPMTSLPPRVGAEAVIRDSAEWVAAMQRLKVAQESKKLAERAYDTARVVVQELMEGDGVDIVDVPGVGRIRWAPQTRRTFDEDAFRQEHPEINLDNFRRITEVRPFTPRFT